MATPRKPEVLRALHGDKADRFNPDAPMAAADEPPMPEGLTVTQVRHWHTVTGHLRAMQLLHASDAQVITGYVVISEKLDRLRVKMGSEPDIIRNPSNGLPMPNPVFDQWLKACTKMEQLSNKLGLNPSARSSIRVKAAQGTPVGNERLFS